MKRIELNPIQAAILRVLDGLRHVYQFVAFRRIAERLPYREKSILAELKLMEKEKLVEVRMYEEPYIRITQKGRDYIAIWDFLKHEEFDVILRPIGKGKESEIWLVYGEKNGLCALKIHRYYRKEFEKFKRSFTFNAIEYWGERLKWKFLSIDFPRLKARVEFEVLKRLEKFKVPKAISLNRHMVLMEFLGDEDPYPQLVKVELEDPKSFKNEILEEYNRIVEKGKIVHGDLNPFNILVSEEDFWIIDWPQSVPSSADFAEEMYRRDIEKIEEYFYRKYKV